VNVGQDNSLNITNDITISAWIKMPVPTSECYKRIWGASSEGEPSPGYDFGVGGATVETGKLSYYSGNTGSWVHSTDRVDDNEWHHVAVVANSAAANFYIDGSLSGSPASNVPSSNTWYKMIGCSSLYTSCTYFKGLIDEVRVYDRALSPDEIKRLYNMGR